MVREENVLQETSHCFTKNAHGEMFESDLENVHVTCNLWHPRGPPVRLDDPEGGDRQQLVMNMITEAAMLPEFAKVRDKMQLQ